MGLSIPFFRRKRRLSSEEPVWFAAPAHTPIPTKKRTWYSRRTKKGQANTERGASSTLAVRRHDSGFAPAASNKRTKLTKKAPAPKVPLFMTQQWLSDQRKEYEPLLGDGPEDDCNILVQDAAYQRLGSVPTTPTGGSAWGLTPIDSTLPAFDFFYLKNAGLGGAAGRLEGVQDTRQHGYVYDDPLPPPPLPPSLKKSKPKLKLEIPSTSDHLHPSLRIVKPFKAIAPEPPFVRSRTVTAPKPIYQQLSEQTGCWPDNGKGKARVHDAAASVETYAPASMFNSEFSLYPINNFVGLQNLLDHHFCPSPPVFGTKGTETSLSSSRSLWWNSRNAFATSPAQSGVNHILDHPLVQVSRQDFLSAITPRSRWECAAPQSARISRSASISINDMASLGRHSGAFLNAMADPNASPTECHIPGSYPRNVLSVEPNSPTTTTYSPSCYHNARETLSHFIPTPTHTPAPPSPINHSLINRQLCHSCLKQVPIFAFPRDPPTKVCTHYPDTCWECLMSYTNAGINRMVGDMDIVCPTCKSVMGFDDVRKFANVYHFRRFVERSALHKDVWWWRAENEGFRTGLEGLMGGVL